MMTIRCIGLAGAAVMALALAGAPAQAAKLTVCASGCDFTTISDALNGAADGDTIRVAAGTYAGGFAITKSIVLSGAGAGRTIIDGSGTPDVPAVSVPGAAVIRIGGVTITGSDNSGLDNVGGSVMLKDSEVSGNRNTKDAGGGIRNLSLMEILNCTIADNDSPVSLAGGAGGGILNEGALTLQNSVVARNTVAGAGGGIYNRPSGTLTIQTSTVGGNTAPQGGGIGNEGALTIRGSAVSENHAGFGGGIFNFNPSGMLVVQSSAVSDNTAVGGGGGIWNGLGGTATLQNSTVAGNLVSPNSAAPGGGGIFNFGTLTVKGTTISGNHADGTYGGGVANLADATKGPTRITNSIITGNTALLGGGIYNTDPSLLVTNSTLTGNTPDDCSGC